MNYIIIIPARFFSSRFPGKLLANIQGKPVIIRVIEQALTAQATKVIVATDSIKIIQAIESERSCLKGKIDICLTQADHRSGTERLVEVVTNYQFSSNQIIVHVQADEPLISANMIHQVARVLDKNKNDISVTTLATPIRSLQEAQDSNIVKVVLNIHNDALYFSRSIIPWFDNYQNLNTVNLLLRHIGIYSYHVNFLYRYKKWIQSLSEQLEMLEQLRVLWYGERIRVSVLDNAFNTVSLNTPESLKLVNKLFLKNRMCNT